MSFLELLRGARASDDWEAVLAAIPYARFLGLKVERGPDGLVSVLPFSPLIVGNPALPAIHGGVTGAFLENAAIMTLLAGMETVKLPKTITITIDYLRSGRPLETRARGVVSRLGRRVATVRMEAWQDNPAQPIAAANVHFLVA